MYLRSSGMEHVDKGVLIMLVICSTIVGMEGQMSRMYSVAYRGHLMGHPIRSEETSVENRPVFCKTLVTYLNAMF